MLVCNVKNALHCCYLIFLFMLPASWRIWNIHNMKMARATPTKTSPTTPSPLPAQAQSRRAMERLDSSEARSPGGLAAPNNAAQPASFAPRCAAPPMQGR